MCCFYFNSRAHVERDYSAMDLFSKFSNFNSRAHVERDARPCAPPTGRAYFNSRAHVERDVTTALSDMLEGNFNSRAHVERDEQGRSEEVLSRGISTHALTWSATLDVVAVGRLLHMIRIRSFLAFKISARCS